MKKAQVYKIKNIEDEKPRLGSFVFHSDDEYVRGFISKEEEDFSEICLWEPIDVSDLKNLIEVVAEEIPHDFITARFIVVLENADDDIVTSWKQLLEEAKEDVDTVG